jgi:DNA polymerase I-like protein with 3'-5' exonuclease and polymerase domains
MFNEFIKENNNDFIGIDFETTGLDALVHHPLLIAIGNAKDQFVIDCTTVNVERFLDMEMNMINHNCKFDLKYFKVHYPEVRIKEIYDTMIMEQKLFQNTSRRFSLDNLVLRYTGGVPAEMIKTTRLEFVNANPNTVIFTDKQINYAATDVKHLHDIRDKQVAMAKSNGQLEWMMNVEFPLIEVLATMELTGFNLDVPALKAIIKKNHQIKFDTAIALDEEVRYLRDTLLPENERIYLKHGKYDRERRNDVKPEYVGLFGEMSEFDYFKPSKAKVKIDKKTRTVKFDDNIGNINWGSPDDIMEIFAKLKQPLPLQGEIAKKYGYLIPVIKNGKLLKHLGINANGEQVTITGSSTQGEGFTIGKKAFIKYFIDNPHTPMRKLIKLLETYTKASHEISSFGENFINNLNPRTNRIHTAIRQCESVNGRLQSGGGKLESDKVNLQNIPRLKEFRQLFYGTKGNSVITCDLTGAEVTFMCDMANDETLYEWAVVNDDSHSPMVQNVWRTIFEYRAGLEAGYWENAYKFFNKRNKDNFLKMLSHPNAEVRKLVDLAINFKVNKKENTAYRVAGKNGTFGGIYGMKARKAQETFNGTDIELAKADPNFKPVNVTLEEGKVILYAQKRAIPKTFAMVERNVQLAFKQGYLVLNDRSNSRIWFEGVINMFKFINSEYGDNVSIEYDGNNSYNVRDSDDEYIGSEELDWNIAKDLDGQARNVPISGTQADCVKEAMVIIDKAIKSHNLTDKCFLLSQVHDELVYDCPKYLDGQSQEWIDNRNGVGHGFVYKADPDDDLYKIAEQGGIHIIGEPYDLSGNRYLDMSFAYFIKCMLIKAANRFLKNVKMQASIEIHDTWTK